MKELNIIQTRLNAPKSKFNSFFGGTYRSAEDIFEALKPLLTETGCDVRCTDEIIVIPCRSEGNSYDKDGNELRSSREGRVFVKSTATLTNASGEAVSATAYAELRDTDCGDKLDPAQRTGSATSYARKYAMGGLFAIDDSRDPDDEGMSRIREEERQRVSKPASPQKPKGDGLPLSTKNFNELAKAYAEGRPMRDGHSAREYFEKHYNATIPQMRLFDAKVEEYQIEMQKSKADADGKVEMGDSPNIDEIFNNA